MMDRKTATVLLESLIERIEIDRTIGSVSRLEKQALQFALMTLLAGEAATEVAPPLRDTQSPSPGDQRNGEPEADQAHHRPVNLLDGTTESSPDASQGLPLPLGGISAETPPPAPDPGLLTDAVMSEVQLVLDCLEQSQPSLPEVMLCLDFGTAMSKAFAEEPNAYMELDLGAVAGRSGYSVPSSVFIGDDGKAYFGFEAIELSQDLGESGRERMDSIKGWLSLRREGNLDGESCLLPKALNPTPIRLTQGEMIRIYLAYLTDLAVTSLSQYEGMGRRLARLVQRRFARPCWPDPDQQQWAEKLMREMLADAQVLADTFSGRWSGGIKISELKSALEQLKKIERRPNYLIKEGVPEPVAVAAGAMQKAQNQRDAFLVVDAGAGTTDFGLFVSVPVPDSDDDQRRVFQVFSSVHGLMQAGDKVDAMLRAYVARKESIDASDTAGKLILADLARRIRGLKETLFRDGRLAYALADGTVGHTTVDEFLQDPAVQRFAIAVEEGLKKSLQAVHESWLNWLSLPGVFLHVVVTGGSSHLPMMRALGSGVIDIKGYKILRKVSESMPDWIESAPDDFREFYPQLAVAIGGAARELPQIAVAPQYFGGGQGPHGFVA